MKGTQAKDRPNFIKAGEEGAQLARELAEIAAHAGDQILQLEAIGHAAAAMLLGDPGGPAIIVEAMHRVLSGD